MGQQLVGGIAGASNLNKVIFLLSKNVGFFYHGNPLLEARVFPNNYMPF